MVDIEYLRQHYALLSDEALREVNRADLVEAARRVYDEEVLRRPELQLQAPEVEEPAVAQNDQPDYHFPRERGEPAWLDEASDAWSEYAGPGGASPPEVDVARAALEAEGIPCYVDVVEEPAAHPEEKDRFRWRILVPGEFSLRATSVIERDLYNDAAIETWKNHLEMLSDSALRASVPKVVYCGLFDRVERLGKTYNDELVRRGMKPLTSRAGDDTPSPEHRAAHG